jgi:CheY-like chemotaxis protein
VPHTLLLADDSVTIQRVIELTFADEDIQVVAVSDGDQAIARMEASPPDVILADIAMPGKSGYEVAQYVKGSPRLSHIPVVLLAGAFERVDQSRADAAGCAGVVAKPFEPQLVIGRVKELLAKSRVAPAEPAKAASPLPTSTVSAPDPTRALLSPLYSSPGPAPPAPLGWPPPDAKRAVTPEPPKPAAADLNNYFDRLDEAFASLTSAGPAAPALSDTAGLGDFDWFGTIDTDGPAAAPDLHGISMRPPAVPPKVQRSSGSPRPAFVGPPAAPGNPPAHDPAAIAPAPVPPPLSAVPGPPPTLPSIADAFSALLAAEQAGASPVAAPQWPASGPAPAPAITADVIEEITQRVLDRLSDRVVRETVSGIVSDIAERLVREEIDRIKASMK